MIAAVLSTRFCTSAEREPGEPLGSRLDLPPLRLAEPLRLRLYRQALLLVNVVLDLSKAFVPEVHAHAFAAQVTPALGGEDVLRERGQGPGAEVRRPMVRPA